MSPLSAAATRAIGLAQQAVVAARCGGTAVRAGAGRKIPAGPLQWRRRQALVAPPAPAIPHVRRDQRPSALPRAHAREQFVEPCRKPEAGRETTHLGVKQGIPISEWNAPPTWKKLWQRTLALGHSAAAASEHATRQAAAVGGVMNLSRGTHPGRASRYPG